MLLLFQCYLIYSILANAISPLFFLTNLKFAVFQPGLWAIYYIDSLLPVFSKAQSTKNKTKKQKRISYLSGMLSAATLR